MLPLRFVFCLVLCSAANLRGQMERPLAGVDAAVREFLAETGLPGAVLAIARRGRLVFERAYGFADRKAKLVMATDARFRIASVTKPFTAVAVLQLVERGKLKLSDKVFALLDTKPVGDREVDPRWRKITVLHLLQHRGGWNRAETFDPMFRSHLVAAEVERDGPARAEDVIRYMVGRPLQFDPGQYFSYSNFGYCVLGRVIEKASGKSYEAFVRESVLRPLGVDGMRLGRTLRKYRAPGEVRYHGQAWRKARSVFAPRQGLSVPWEYGGFHLEAMDAHAGWLATAREVLRFACDFDDPRHSRLLSAAMITRMFARPPGLAGTDREGKPRELCYACGWEVTNRAQSHGGSLPGSLAKLVRRKDGVNWVVLFNGRLDRKGRRVHPDDFQRTLRPVLDGIKAWPDQDLFAR